MIDVYDLYQDLIVDHGRRPRNSGHMQRPTHQAKGFNPLCGDEITLFIAINKSEIIEDVKFVATGCAISVASASLMSEAVKGKTIQEVKSLFNNFHKLVTKDSDETIPANIGKLSVLAGVKAFPTRVKCATLTWHTLQEALENHGDATGIVTTE